MTATAAAAAAAEPDAPSTTSDPPNTADQERQTGQANYSLIAPPSYETIVGGVAPSPFVSSFMLLGIAALVGTAVGSALGLATVEWWLVAGLLLLVATLMAGFVSRGS